MRNKNRYSLSEENNNTETPEVNCVGLFFYSAWKNTFSDGKYKLSEKSPNSFQIYLNGLIKEELGLNAQPSKDEMAFREFFTCPVLKLLSIPKKFGAKAKILSNCITEVL